MTHLSFHLNERRADYRDSDERNYLARFLYEQGGRANSSSTIERLHLYVWDFGPIRLDDCLYSAMDYNKIRELDITLDAYGSSVEIPYHLFTSLSLHVFKLKSVKSPCNDSQVKLPRSLLLAAHLKTLELVNVEPPEFPNGQGKVVLSCPVLETLVLMSCFFRTDCFLSISTPRLKRLVIDNIRIRYEEGDEEYGGIVVELDTPNLLSFVYTGGFSNYFHSMGSLSKLVSAEMGAFTTDWDDDLEGRDRIEVLNCLRNASTLVLERFESFPPEVTDLLGETLTSFTNLKTLELRTKIEEVGFLLAKCSSIETLVLLLTNQFISDREKKEKLVLPKRCSLNNLKYVAVRRARGHNRELGFLRFLLDNAEALEQMSIIGYESKNHDLLDQTPITYFSCERSANYHKVPRKALMKFGDKLLKLSKKFPTVELSFKIL